ncbi:MAG: hypothetical protein P8184_14995 [Calditrichia bacterium]
MQNKWMFSAAAILLLALLISFAGLPPSLLSQQPQKPKEHKLSILKIKKKWKVARSNDSTQTRVVAQRGDKIVWKAKGSDVFFQFSDDKLFGEYNATLKNGKKLELTVGPEARSGPNVYSVFCLADSSFATGDSPPVIIVEP